MEVLTGALFIRSNLGMIKDCIESAIFVNKKTSNVNAQRWDKVIRRIIDLNNKLARPEIDLNCKRDWLYQEQVMELNKEIEDLH